MTKDIDNKYWKDPMAITPSAMEQLTPRHFMIMDLLIQGSKTGEIAKRIGMTHAWVCTIVNDASFQHRLAIRRAKFTEKLDEKAINTVIEAGDTLKKHAVDAANKLVEMLDTGTPGLQKASAVDILDRVGIGKQTQNSTSVSSKVVIIDEKSATVIEKLLIEEKVS